MKFYLCVNVTFLLCELVQQATLANSLQLKRINQGSTFSGKKALNMSTKYEHELDKRTTKLLLFRNITMSPMMMYLNM